MNTKYKNDLTIVVPFYKRDNYALEIIRLVNKENLSLLYKIEIIFVDSNSSVYLSKKLINFPTQIIGCPIVFISTFGQPKKISIQTEKKIIRAIFIKPYDNNILN